MMDADRWDNGGRVRVTAGHVFDLVVELSGGETFDSVEWRVGRGLLAVDDRDEPARTARWLTSADAAPDSPVTVECVFTRHDQRGLEFGPRGIYWTVVIEDWAGQAASEAEVAG